jgi:hypothetical protein
VLIRAQLKIVNTGLHNLKTNKEFETMAAYADYTFYTGTYLGTAIVSANFARLALRASEQIDALTFDRAAAIITTGTDTTLIVKIKNATCAVAEEIQDQETNDIDGITSESVGSYSVSFGATSSKTLTNQTKLSNTARVYLGNTGLMFKGFAPDELGTVMNDAD